MREQQHWAMFIDWMCPSIRVKDKNFLRKGNENNTDAARMKDVRGFWDEITSELGITGEAAQRMFRNTHENRVNAQRKARSTWDVISVTGRADTRSAESYYLNKKLNIPSSPNIPSFPKNILASKLAFAAPSIVSASSLAASNVLSPSISLIVLSKAFSD